ncbi:tyrosine-type recombinase/integrase [Nonomuraea polychroma]|uniref:tyrosine-type recombinase/integrase n=1 Tax=Nonomuraea polychroma TaxID=46176 RepID=UPI003D8B479D
MTSLLPVRVDDDVVHGEVVEVVGEEQPKGNAYWTYLRGLDSPHSRRTMRGDLDRLARIIADVPLDSTEVSGADVDWHRFDHDRAIQLRERLTEQGWKTSYVNHHLVAFRQVLRAAWRIGLMNGDDYERARDVKNVKGQRKPAGDHIPDDVIGALLAACHADERPAGVRDGAIIAVFYSTGCRRQELVDAVMTDYTRSSRRLRLIGKGNKERVVFLSRDAGRWMERWLAIRGTGPGALFPPVHKSGSLRRRNGHMVHMSGQAVRDVLNRRFKQAEVAWHPTHDFRRTFISNMLPLTDLVTVSTMVGHTNPATTAAYDRRDEETLQQAADLLAVPDARPL